MRFKSLLTFLAIISSSLFLLTVNVAAQEVPAQESNDNQDNMDNKDGKSFYQYAAQFTCGTNPQATARVLPGQYATSVNIHNPKDSNTQFRKKIALTFPPAEQKAGAVSEPIVDELGPMEALKVACEQIPAEFFPAAIETPYVHGFLVIESRSELNVTAVYTTGSTETVDSIDVEEVTGKLISY